MAENVIEVNRCPVCDEIYTDHQTTCLVCGLELNSGEPLLIGHPNPQQVEESLGVLNQHRQALCQAALILSWSQGVFDAELFRSITNDTYANELSSLGKTFEIQYQDKFLPMTRENQSSLHAGIYSLVMSSEKELILIDAGPELLTLARVSSTNNQLTTHYHFIPWSSIEQYEEANIRNSLALVAGFRQIDIQWLSDQIRSGLRTLNISQPQSLLLCTRLFGGRHIPTIHKAIELAGNQVLLTSYIIGKSPDFPSFLGSLLERAPLHHALALAVVQVTPEGKVTSQYRTLFPARQFIASSNSAEIRVKSYNKDGDEIDLVVVRSEDGKQEPSLYQAWKGTLPFGHEASLTFTLQNREKLSATGIPVHASQILPDILQNLPASISTTAIEFDLVLLIDTIANDETFNERRQMAKDILNAVLMENPPGEIRITAIAYGDYYVLGNNVPKGWPDPIRIMKWRPVTEIIEFLDNLKPTPPEGCDFESALDEALEVLSKLDFHEHASRWALTLGQFKPHSKIKLPRCSQVPSPQRLDWVTIVHRLHEGMKVNSLAVIWSLQEFLKILSDELASVPERTEEFWDTFAYTQSWEAGKINPDKIAQKIVSTTKSPEKNLTLPVMV